MHTVFCVAMHLSIHGDLSYIHLGAMVNPIARDSGVPMSEGILVFQLFGVCNQKQDYRATE